MTRRTEQWRELRDHIGPIPTTARGTVRKILEQRAEAVDEVVRLREGLAELRDYYRRTVEEITRLLEGEPK